MPILVQIENEEDQVHLFQCVYFLSFQIHLQVILYHSEHTNHDNHLYFYY